MSSFKYRHLCIGTTVFVDRALVYPVIIILSENYEASTSSLLLPFIIALAVNRFKLILARLLYTMPKWYTTMPIANGSYIYIQ